MRTELGELLRSTRLSLGLRLPALAGRLGYRNQNRGARRLERLERSGQDESELINRVADALGLDAKLVANKRERDEVIRRKAFEAWVSVPQPMRLLTMVAGVAIELPLPEGLMEQQAITYAMDLWRQKKIRLCLVLSRRRLLWISAEGTNLLAETTIDSPNVPYTTIG